VPECPIFAGATDAQRLGAERANFFRLGVGLSCLSLDAALSEAAQGHADWMAANGVFGHTQNAGSEGFTGARAQDRVEAAGGTDFRYEDIASTSNAADAMDQLVHTVYHRVPYFDPEVGKFGIGISQAGVVVDFGGGGADSGCALYPFHGQNDVPPVFFSDQEGPDPVTGRNAVGQPVSLHCSGPVSITSFSLQGPQGEEPVVEMGPGQADPAGFLTTRTRFWYTTEAAQSGGLAGGAEYRVEVRGEHAGSPFTLRSDFQTAP
jgi:hypothetical protein